MEEIESHGKKELNSDERVADFQKKLDDICREFWTRKLIQVCGQDVTLLPTVFEKTSIQELMANMLFDKAGKPIHRVALLDQAAVTAIVTQSDVIKFVANHKEELGAALEQPVESLGLYNSKNGVVTVSTDTSAMEAFHLMYTKKLSCVGIVDSNGVLTGNLSNSDLRGIEADRFSHLSLGVAEFLRISKALSRPFATVLNARLNALRALAIPKGSTFKELLTLVEKNRVHRAYVVDKEFKPVGIITLSDILNMLSKTESK